MKKGVFIDMLVVPYEFVEKNAAYNHCIIRLFGISGILIYLRFRNQDAVDLIN